jgi:hypothetical protein
MNDFWNQPPLGPTAPLGEILLASTAIRIELPPSQHQLAVDRYDAVRKYIERAGSPLCDRVRAFYPQGSMAIRSTIKSRKRIDGFDIDIVAELILSHTTLPGEVLDMLFEAINGPPGSQYHGMTERQSRCVTVYYADGMHLDITPTLLISELDPRLSHLCHAKAEEHPSQHKKLVMNSHAFCEWFNSQTPIDLKFEQAYAKRAMAFDARMRAEADVKPVPAHSTMESGKSATVVALQLLKRNRNLLHEKRKGRMPPSVMMAKLAAEASVPGSSIAGALGAISLKILLTLEGAELAGALVDVRNPCCAGERYTDRWPEDRAAQRTYIEDLKLFRHQLEALMSDRLMLDQKRDILVRMFGEGPAQSVIADYAASIGQSVSSGNRSIGPSGRVIPAAVAGLSSASTTALSQPRGHTFFGTSWKHR